MKMISWNVNGLRAVSKKGFSDWILKENPDILCIQETKLQEEQLVEQLRNIEGYESYFSFARRKGYSGVAIYTRHKPISIKYGFGIEKFDSEGRILQMEYPGFTLLNIYFPNGQMNDERLQYKLDFHDILLEYCLELRKEKKNLIICGDYNIAHKEMDLKNPKANEKRSGFLPIERSWIDKFIENGFIDSFRYINPEKIQYSWWSYRYKARERNAGWRIDYHFISQEMKEKIREANILEEVMGSDHCPVSLVIDL